MKTEIFFSSTAQISESSGLTSMQQITDVTSNEIFSITHGTSDTEIQYVVHQPVYRKIKTIQYPEPVELAEETVEADDTPFFGENIRELKKVFKAIFLK